MTIETYTFTPMPPTFLLRRGIGWVVILYRFQKHLFSAVVSVN